MATITTIAASDLITNSRTVINTNFSNLNSDKMETSVLDTDTALTANSDSKVATQKATKAYVDGTIGGTSFAAGTFTKNTNSTTTNTIAHGLGGTPRIVRLWGFYAEDSTVYSIAHSVFVASTQNSASIAFSDTTTTLTQTFRLTSAGAVTEYLTGTMTVDATNITITWIKTSSPTGTANFVWEAQR